MVYNDYVHSRNGGVSINTKLENKIIEVFESKLRFSKVLGMAVQNVYKISNPTIETYVDIVDTLRLDDEQAMELMRGMVDEHKANN